MESQSGNISETRRYEKVIQAMRKWRWPGNKKKIHRKKNQFFCLLLNNSIFCFVLFWPTKWVSSTWFGLSIKTIIGQLVLFFFLFFLENWRRMKEKKWKTDVWNVFFLQLTTEHLLSNLSYILETKNDFKVNKEISRKEKDEKWKKKIKKKVWRYVVSIFCIFGALTYHMLVYWC